MLKYVQDMVGVADYIIKKRVLVGYTDGGMEFPGFTEGSVRCKKLEPMYYFLKFSTNYSLEFFLEIMGFLELCIILKKKTKRIAMLLSNSISLFVVVNSILQN